ncbi:MAG: hypothetical protein RL217_147 [Pseudomonadota bacterium]|jgi:type I restriction-modification system DNA methylase subunit
MANAQPIPITQNSIPDSLMRLLHDLLVEPKASHIYNLLHTPELWHGNYFLTLMKILTSEKVQRMAVLVPDIVARGRASTSNEDKSHRIELLSKNFFDAAITLPSQLITTPYGPVVILLFDSHKEGDSVLFIQASQKYQTEHSKEFLLDGQMRKIFATYRRVRSKQPPLNEVSSPVCYADEFGVIQPGIVVDRYAYLATPLEIGAKHCSVNPADFVR